MHVLSSWDKRDLQLPAEVRLSDKPSRRRLALMLLARIHQIQHRAVGKTLLNLVRGHGPAIRAGSLCHATKPVGTSAAWVNPSASGVIFRSSMLNYCDGAATDGWRAAS